MTALNLAQFSSKTFVQRALKNPNSVSSVLSFFFGVDYDDQPTYQDAMRCGEPLWTMTDLWFHGGPEYDALCVNLRDTIRSHKNWRADHLDALTAEMILCDQLSRNAFRGTAEAFQYDETACEIAKRLAASELATGPNIEGELYPSYASFVFVPMMHSEEPEDHEMCMHFIDFMLQRPDVAGSPKLVDWFNYQKTFEQEHKEIIDRFGRYPHRNKANGRENTAEEDQWLADVDNLPGWAKSQLVSL